MKKKTIVSVLITLVVCVFFTLTAVACGGNGNQNDNKSTTKDKASVSTKILKDLKDFSSAATAAAVTYNKTTKDEQIAELVKKQAALVLDKDKDKTEGDQIDDADEEYSTYTKIFYRADATEIVDRMAYAGLEESRMVKLVGYISRQDTDRSEIDNANPEHTVPQKVAEGYYNLTVGEESLLRDYEDVQELEEFYNDHTDNTAVYDALAKKRRKMSQESILIFGEEAGQYGRVMLEELCYVFKVVDQRVAKHNSIDLTQANNDDFIDYFRDVYFDYETLSYLLAFQSEVDLSRDQYEPVSANGKTDYVKLYAYHYQYQKADTQALTDDEHTEYLRLYHESAQGTLSDDEAIRYHDLDYISYSKAYRYSAEFYKVYYELHFEFQQKQEEFDSTIYVGGSVTGQDSSGDPVRRYQNGLGQAISGSSTTYSGEMLNALTKISSVLKISDVEMEYFLYTDSAGRRINVINMNTRNTAWNSLSTTRQSQRANKIKKVEYEVQNLRMQKYVMDYTPYLSNTDLSNALIYQIYSYSADYIRAIQAYKKEDVILNKELDRLDQSAKDYAQQKAAKEDEIGRNYAISLNLVTNYTQAGVSSQVDTATKKDWKGVNSEITTAIGRDYATYDKNNQTANTKAVDEYFEDNLIKKVWSCGGTDDQCGLDGRKGHSSQCSEDYDTDCAISRTVYDHQSVFRHTYGQVMIIYAKNETDMIRYAIDTVTETYNPTLGIGDSKGGTLSKNAKARPSSMNYSDQETGSLATETISTDDAPTVVVFDPTNKSWNGYNPKHLTGDEKPAAIMPNDSQLGWTSRSMSGTMVTVDKDGTMRYTTSEGAGANQKNYEYILEFDGWFLDKECKYRVRHKGDTEPWGAEVEEDDTFSYDVRLYPGYRIYKVEVKK